MEMSDLMPTSLRCRWTASLWMVCLLLFAGTTTLRGFVGPVPVAQVVEEAEEPIPSEEHSEQEEEEVANLRSSTRRALRRALARRNARRRLPLPLAESHRRRLRDAAAAAPVVPDAFVRPLRV